MHLGVHATETLIEFQCGSNGFEVIAKIRAKVITWTLRDEALSSDVPCKRLILFRDQRQQFGLASSDLGREVGGHCLPRPVAEAVASAAYFDPESLQFSQ